MTASLLQISGLESGYGEVQVLWGVDLDVAAGEIVCVIGSNGAGKTTLLRTISGLVAIRAGKVTIAGQDFTGATPAQVLGAGVAHVPEGRRLFSAMSVEDNLRMGAHMRSDEADIRRDLAQIYELFPILGDRRRQEAGTLSGGEQQMCAIGRGIMSRPKLLMIDELSLGLAPKAVEQLSAAPGFRHHKIWEAKICTSRGPKPLDGAKFVDQIYAILTMRV